MFFSFLTYQRGLSRTLFISCKLLFCYFLLILSTTDCKNVLRGTPNTIVDINLDDILTDGKPPYIWEILKVGNSSTRKWRYLTTGPEVKVQCDDPGVYQLDVIFRQSSVNFNSKYEFEELDMSEASRATFTINIDYPLPPVSLNQNFNELIFICTTKLLRVSYDEPYKGSSMVHNLFFNGSVVATNRDILLITFVDVGNFNLTLESQNLAWRKTSFMGVVSVTDQIEYLEMRTSQNVLQLGQCAMLSVVYNGPTLPSGDLKYSWIIASDEDSKVFTSENSDFLFCPIDPGDFSVSCKLNLQVFCDDTQKYISGKTDAVPVVVVNLLPDHINPNDEPYFETLLGSRKQNNIFVDKTQLACYCSSSSSQVHQKTNCVHLLLNKITRVSLTNCNSSSATCFEESVFALSLQLANPSSVTWSVDPQLRAWIEILYRNSDSNINNVYLEIGGNFSQSGFSLTAILNRESPISASCRVVVRINVNPLPKEFYHFQQSEVDNFGTVDTRARCPVRRSSVVGRKRQENMSREECQKGSPVDLLLNSHVNNMSNLVFPRKFLNLFNAWYRNCVASMSILTQFEQEWVLNQVLNNLISQTNRFGPPRYPFSIFFSSSHVMLGVSRIDKPRSDMHLVSPRGSSEVSIGQTDVASVGGGLTGNNRMSGGCLNVVYLQLKNYTRHTKELSFKNISQVTLGDPVIVKQAQCFHLSTRKFSIEFRSNWEIPASNFITYRRRTSFARLIFKSTFNGVNAVGLFLQSDLLSPTIWPLKLEFTCSSVPSRGSETSFSARTNRGFSSFSFRTEQTLMLNTNNSWICEAKLTPGIRPNSPRKASDEAPDDVLVLKLGFVGIGCAGTERRDSQLANFCHISRVEQRNQFFCKCVSLFGWMYKSFYKYEPLFIEVEEATTPSTSDVTDRELYFGIRSLFAAVFLIATLVVVVKIVVLGRRAEDSVDKILNHVDNSCRNNHCYALSVETGNMVQTGTTNRVFCILHGEQRNSETKELFSDDVRCFSSASITTFLISTPQSLGKLSRVTIWHDRAPVFGSQPQGRESKPAMSVSVGDTEESVKCWYVNRVTVVDIHSLDLYDFPVFEWIGPGFRDGRTDRIVLRRKAKSLEKCIKKELLSVTLNSLESFSPFVFPRFRRRSACVAFIFFSLHLIVTSSLSFAAFVPHEFFPKALMLYPGGVFLLPPSGFFYSSVISLFVTTSSFLFYWLLNHIPNGYLGPSGEYMQVPSNHNSLTKQPRASTASNDFSPTQNGPTQKWWFDIETWAERAAETGLPDHLSCEMNSLGTTPGTSRRNSCRYFSRETLSSQSAIREMCHQTTIYTIPKSVVFQIGFHSCILFTLLCAVFSCLLVIRTEDVHVWILFAKIALCVFISSFLLLFPLGCLLCALISAIVSWSWKFPLHQRFVFHLPHACSPLMRLSPTRKSSAGGAMDIFDISDSVTSSCLALAIRQRARYLKYVRPPELQSLRSYHVNMLHKLNVLHTSRLILEAFLKLTAVCIVFTVLAASQSEFEMSTKISSLFNTCSAQDDSTAVLNLKTLQLNVFAAWFDDGVFLDLSNITELNRGINVKTFRRGLIFSPVENLFGLVDRRRNSSGDWLTTTVFVPCNWSTRQCLAVMCVQFLSFLWICSRLKTVFFSATRNYSFLDINLFLQVLFPSLAFLFALLFCGLWHDTQMLRTFIKYDAKTAVEVTQDLYSKITTMRLVLAAGLFCYLLSSTLPFAVRSKKTVSLVERCLTNPYKSVIVPNKFLLTVSSLVLLICLMHLRNAILFEPHLSFRWSLPCGMLVFVSSRIFFPLDKLEDRRNAATMSQRHSSFTFMESVVSISRNLFRRLFVSLIGSVEYDSLSKASNSAVNSDPFKRYHVPLRLECLMEELEKQVDELMYRTLALTSQLKQYSESPYGTCKSRSTGADNSDVFISSSKHRRAHSLDQYQNQSFSFSGWESQRLKFSSGEDWKTTQCGPTLMQLRLLASSSANLDEKSRDNVLECLEEVVYNKLCGQYEFLFEKEFELELLLNFLVSDDSDAYWKISEDVYSRSRLSLNGSSSPRIRSQSAAALVRPSEYESTRIDDVTTPSMRTASSEDKLSISVTKGPDGLVQPIKIVYPSSSYEKSKTVKLHRLCQETVTSLRPQTANRAMLTGIKLQQMNRNHSDQCLTRDQSSVTESCIIEPRLRNLSGSRTKLRRTRTLKGGGMFLDKL